MTPPPAEQFAARIFLGPALRAQPDRRLVDLVRDGYDGAFEEIVRRYRRPLDRFAAAIVGGRSEDVTQDAFSKALMALRGSRAEIELRPWLYRIVRNTALNDLRDRGPLAEELPETLAGAGSAASEVEAREELSELMGRLQALPESQRAALVMRELEGLSHDEIAAALGVSGGAARQAIYRARATLREGLGLLVPLPALRALVDHADEATGAGGAITGAGASSAGGAALGGLGAGAVKAGLATVLVVGAVGAGIAVENHGERSGPEEAQAAPLIEAEKRGAHPVAADESGAGRSERSGAGRDDNDFGDSNRGREDEEGGSADDADRHSSNSGSGHSGGGSDHSGGGSGGDSGSGSNSGPGSDSDSHSGSGSSSGSGGHDDGGEEGIEGHDNSGPGSDDEGISGDSGSGGDDGGHSGSGDSGGSNSVRAVATIWNPLPCRIPPQIPSPRQIR